MEIWLHTPANSPSERTTGTDWTEGSVVPQLVWTRLWIKTCIHAKNLTSFLRSSGRDWETPLIITPCRHPSQQKQAEWDTVAIRKVSEHFRRSNHDGNTTTCFDVDKTFWFYFLWMPSLRISLRSETCRSLILVMNRILQFVFYFTFI